MEDIVAKKKVHQGRNVRLGRGIRGKLQNDLAFELNIHQTVVSDLENSETIEDKTLQKIATALELPLEFFKNFNLEEAANSFYNTQTIHSATDSKEIISQINHDQVNNYPLTEIMDMSKMLSDMQKESHEKEILLYAKLGEKDVEIALLKKDNESLKKK